jgi:hypothetical protein
MLIDSSAVQMFRARPNPVHVMVRHHPYICYPQLGDSESKSRGELLQMKHGDQYPSFEANVLELGEACGIVSNSTCFKGESLC